MLRAIEFYAIMWLVVTTLILVYKEFTCSEKVSIMKAVLFGAGTALIAFSAVFFIVILF